MGTFRRLACWVVVAGLLAVAGPPAAASATEFHVSEAEASLSGDLVEVPIPLVISLGGNEVECSVASQSGSTGSTTFSTLSVHPSLSSCKAFGFSSATVTTTGCELAYEASGSLDLAGCSAGPSGEAMTIATVTCKVEIPNQGELGSAAFENRSGTLRLEATVSGIAYTVVESGFLCPLSEGEGTNGTLEEIVDVEANGGSAEIWIE